MKLGWSEGADMTDDPDPHPSLKVRRARHTDGHSHFVTFSCLGRRKFLESERSRDWLANAVAGCRAVHSFDLWGYVVMPEHVHLLLRPRAGEAGISAILQRIKHPVGLRAANFVRTEVPDFAPKMTVRSRRGKPSLQFWQAGGGHDSEIWTDALLWVKLGYMHRNPVERELCALPTDWRWSSARWYEGDEDGPIAVDRLDRRQAGEGSPDGGVL